MSNSLDIENIIEIAMSWNQTKLRYAVNLNNTHLTTQNLTYNPISHSQFPSIFPPIYPIRLQWKMRGSGIYFHSMYNAIDCARAPCPILCECNSLCEIIANVWKNKKKRRASSTQSQLISTWKRTRAPPRRAFNCSWSLRAAILPARKCVLETCAIYICEDYNCEQTARRGAWLCLFVAMTATRRDFSARFGTVVQISFFAIHAEF